MFVRREKEEANMSMAYIDQYLKETITITESVYREEIEKGIEILKEVR